MAKYLIKKYIYKNGLLSTKKPLDKIFNTEVEARKYAYKIIQEKADTLGIFEIKQRGLPFKNMRDEKEIGFIYFRDFKSLYPYGKWTFYDSEKTHALLKSDGTIDRRSESTIADEREPRYRKK